MEREMDQTSLVKGNNESPNISLRYEFESSNIIQQQQQEKAYEPTKNKA